MKRKITLALIFSFLLTQPAFADKLLVSTNGRITYPVEFETSGGEAVLNLMKNGATFTEEMWSTDDASGIEYFGFAEVGENKTATFKFNLTTPGKYRAEVSYKGKTTSEDLTYIVSSSFSSTVSALNSSKEDVSVLTDKLTNGQAALGLWNDLYDSADKGEVAKILSNTLATTTLSASKADEVLKVLEGCFVVEALNAGRITDISEYTDVLDIPETIMTELWKNEYAGEITSRISQKGYEKASDVVDSAEEAAALVKILHADGYGEVIDVVNLLSAKIGVSGISESVARVIQNKNYNSYQELKNAINSASAPVIVGGSGGAGGGGTTSKKQNNISIGAIETVKPQVSEPTEVSRRFNDLESVEWAADAIEELAVLGIVNGKSQGEFCPQDRITREEFLTLLVNTFHINIVGEDPNFSDVTEDKWFYDYVIKAYNSGIVKGISDTEFGSGRNITRQDLAVMVYNVLALCDVQFKNTEDSFADDNDISEYAKTAVNSMKSEGIMVGTDNCFNPKAYTTRAEAAKVIHTLLKYSREGSGI